MNDAIRFNLNVLLPSSDALICDMFCTKYSKTGLAKSRFKKISKIGFFYLNQIFLFKSDHDLY